MSERVTLHLDGRAIDAAWWNRGSAREPLVLLHEGLGSVGLWRGFPAALAEATGRAVFAYSRFGHGRSAPASLPRHVDYMHEEARLLPRVLDEAGIGPCVLVGHSDGGSIAVLHAGGSRDDRIRGLALLAPHFFVEDLTIAGIEAAREAWRSTDLPARMARHHDDPAATFWGWNDIWLDPAFRSWRIEDAVARVQVPILILQGTADEYGTVAQLELAQAVAGCMVERLLLEGARHSPHLDQGPATIEAIRAFAERIFDPQTGPGATRTAIPATAV